MNASVSIQRSATRKRSVALQVQPDGTLQVQAPLRTSLKWIEAFIASRARWIDRRRAEIARENDIAPLTPETNVPFLGEEKPLRAFCPDAAAMTDPAELRTELILWYKKQARREIPARAALWVEKTGLRPSKIIVANQKQRWGSCNEANEIRLNWKLVLSPPELVDYVIVHELAHIRHKDHSGRFWACVASFMPDWKRRRAALRHAEKSPIHHTLA